MENDAEAESVGWRDDRKETESKGGSREEQSKKLRSGQNPGQSLRVSHHRAVAADDNSHTQEQPPRKGGWRIPKSQGETRTKKQRVASLRRRAKNEVSAKSVLEQFIGEENKSIRALCTPRDH